MIFDSGYALAMLIGAAEMSVTAHLIDLEKRGLAAMAGDIWHIGKGAE